MDKKMQGADNNNSPILLSARIQEQKLRVEQAKDPITRKMHEDILRCMQLALQRSMGYKKSIPE